MIPSAHAAVAATPLPSLRCVDCAGLLALWEHAATEGACRCPGCLSRFLRAEQARLEAVRRATL